jgi:hypothetical protein
MSGLLFREYVFRTDVLTPHTFCIASTSFCFVHLTKHSTSLARSRLHCPSNTCSILSPYTRLSHSKPVNQVTLDQVLRKRKTSYPVRLVHSCVQNALLQMANCAFNDCGGVCLRWQAFTKAKCTVSEPTQLVLQAQSGPISGFFLPFDVGRATDMRTDLVESSVRTVIQ